MFDVVVKLHGIVGVVVVIFKQPALPMKSAQNEMFMDEVFNLISLTFYLNL